MWFHIDASSGTPIYRQITDQVRQAIAGGTLRPGDRLPAVRDLAVELAVNPNTIAKAYQDLERDGVIETSRGRGTYVSSAKSAVPESERVKRLRPVIDRLIAEAYLLGISEDDLGRLLQERLAERRTDQKHE
ncbi:MAG: GntR family transcriptional regulator [Bacillota bacterium]